MTQKKIGELLGGIDYSAVNKLRRRIQKRMAHDKQIAAQYMETERKIKELMSNVEI
jgi:chromosomal replication initiation ATPase DnaA